MPVNETFARRMRRERLHRHGDRGLLVVALDHPIGAGPIVRDGRLDPLLRAAAHHGADAVVLHKGALRHVRTGWFRGLSLIVHLSASTGIAPDPDAKVLVTGVEEALRLGADGVSVHVNAGSPTEARQLADLASVADACDRWGLPLLAMIYPRGPGIRDGRDPDLVAHAVTVAAEIGADLVKTALPADAAQIARITAACPIPVLAAGGTTDGGATAVLEHLGTALRSGAAGAAVGRLIFEAPDPGAMTRSVAALVHDQRVPALL
ncbi:2-amino-3,7-dideoxy-D-threo-hept-6-ulosonate synthase [Catenuloplanes indicus]|uniref:2-amino-4, 5-dihydroxy-6-oxo-7-(Phosphonooxy)heptanoate synthase n=1 Tax=Catenuloplanes indicus TaxID=137267 RepID=A0AAE3W5D7_9ACTN|nr:2-amino-3,7-dideoxy-D-threo-hept-6-ulosonate synthase [Catenuloplanes indicus]MDQ0369746.1 2-amino-4,5-dihydroxy-6-oxo-7-(phosphonooxy)heptanoate synthase [Catenuloplanes indicus]